MRESRFFSRRAVAVILALLAGSLLLAFNLSGQTASAPAEAQAPLAKLDKLRDALKAARAARDAKAVAAALNRIGELQARISDFPSALDSYGQALRLAQSQGDGTDRGDA